MVMGNFTENEFGTSTERLLQKDFYRKNQPNIQIGTFTENKKGFFSENQNQANISLTNRVIFLTFYCLNNYIYIKWDFLNI